MKRNLVHRALANPLFLILPFTALLGFGWHQYTYAGLALSVPAEHANLLANGNFDEFGTNDVPVGWEVRSSQGAAYQLFREGGHVGGSSFGVRVTDYPSGDVTLTSPRVTVTAHQTYLFKGYYKSDMGFELLVRTFYKDGTTKLQVAQDYPETAKEWSTASDAFKPSETVAAVQFVYRLAAVGSMEINGLYLEPKREVYVASESPMTSNAIPNSVLAADKAVDMPDGWTTYQAGANAAAFSYVDEDGAPYLRVVTSQYKDGEAKWQYAPQAVVGHQYYQFGVRYRSDVPTEIVMESVDAQGKRQFTTLAGLQPASEWTEVHTGLEVPSGARTMFVAVVLKRAGTLETQDYQLVNATKPGKAAWNRPLVSITFDDGWRSAYTDAVPVLNHYGYAATFYVNPSSIETPNFMRAEDLKKLAAGGNEIAAHGYAHDDMTAIDDAELSYQLRQGRDYLRAAGFSVADFATPYGKSDAEVQWYARQYFQTLRGTELGINTRQSFDPYNLKVLYVDVSTKEKTVATALQQTQLNHGWLILVYHGLGADGTTLKSLKVEGTRVPVGAFADQMALVKKSGMTVLPLSAANAEVRKQ